MCLKSISHYIKDAYRYEGKWYKERYSLILFGKSEAVVLTHACSLCLMSLMSTLVPKTLLLNIN